MSDLMEGQSRHRWCAEETQRGNLEEGWHVAPPGRAPWKHHWDSR